MTMKRGYTLIELLIVVALIGGIVALVVLGVGHRNEKATDVPGITTFCLEGQVHYRKSSWSTEKQDAIWLKLGPDGKPIPCGQHRSAEKN